MRKPHVIVVGAGLVGAAIAYRLAPQASVTVIEATSLAAQASGKSFGWINASFFHDDHHHALRAVAMAAHRRLDALIDTGTRWTGSLWWEETGTAFDYMRDRLMSLGYPVRELDARAFALAEPDVGTPPDRCLHFPSEGAVDPAALTQRLIAAAEAAGARVWLGSPVLGFVTAGAGVAGIVTETGPVAADHVVLATGTATEALLSPLGHRLPMLRRPGVLLRSQPLRPLIRHILVGPGGEVRQDADGCIHVPAALSHQSDAAETVAPLDALSDATMQRMRDLLPGADLRWSQVTLGQRPVPADGLPVVGQVMPGLTVATMHSGVTLAALIGELVAAEVMGQGDSAWLTPYRPGRFAL